MRLLYILLIMSSLLCFGCISLPNISWIPFTSEEPQKVEDTRFADMPDTATNDKVAERVAVLPFTGGEGREGDTIAQMLGTELTKLGHFQIVPRTAAINKVMEEHNFQRGGLTDGDTIVELGRGANAQYVVSGHIQNLGTKKMISASIVNVETFQQIAGGYYEDDDLSEVKNYLPLLAKKIATGTEKDYSGVPTLAILPFDSEDENNSDVLAQLLAIELANSGKYVVVSRITTIETVMQEQNIQRSGLTDSDTISKLGLAMNADYVLCGSASTLGSSGFMNAQIINVLNLVQEDGAYVEYETIEDGVKLMPVLSYELTGVGENEAKAALAQPTQERNEEIVATLTESNADFVTKIYSIGDIEPGDGLIFYIEGNMYFECSIVLGSESWDDAFDLAEHYLGGEYDDWYLPSKAELNYIYENLRMAGYIGDGGEFWSSSNDSSVDWWTQRFSDGKQGSDMKFNHHNVRAVRTFRN